MLCSDVSKLCGVILCSQRSLRHAVRCVHRVSTPDMCIEMTQNQLKDCTHTLIISRFYLWIYLISKAHKIAMGHVAIECRLLSVLDSQSLLTLQQSSLAFKLLHSDDVAAKKPTIIVTFAIKNLSRITHSS